MPTGSCFCGKVKVEYTGDPSMKCLCHCVDCRKIGGSTYSSNHIVPEQNFNLVSGTPKQITKTADSGKEITSYFCGDCGTTLWRDGQNSKGMKVIRAGILDNQEDIEKHPPVVELYGRQRVNWVKEVDGAEQKDGMGA